MVGVSRIAAWSRTMAAGQNPAQQVVVLFVASSVGNGLGYVYHVFVGRALEPGAFGAFGALFGIFYVASLAGDALRIAVASNVAARRSQLGANAAVAGVLRSLRSLLIGGLVLVVALAAGAPGIARFFHMESAGPVLVLAAALGTVLFLFVALGLLQGLQMFQWLALVGYLLPHGLKLVLAVLFISVGFGLVGAIWALLLANLVAIGVGAVPLARFGRGLWRLKGHIGLSPGRLVVPALLMAAIISVPTSVDVMLVTHFFGPPEAGIYNVAAVLGKVVAFIPLAVSLVMLPRVSERFARGEDASSALMPSMALTLFVSGCVALVYWVVPGWLVNLVFGGGYQAAAPLIGWYGGAMALFAGNYLFAQYHLAASDRRGVWLAVMVTAAEVVVIIVAHSSMLQVVQVLLFGNLLLLSLNLLRLPRRRCFSRGRRPASPRVA